MESINETKVKNNLWKRLSRGVGTEHVSALAARFRKLFSDLAACVRPARSTFPDGDTKSPTKGGESNTNPIFRGPQITVPWTSPVFAYHTSGYITNAEVNAQVKLLELRFRKQSEILSRHEHRTSVLHKISATLIPYFNDEKVAEMADLVEKIKLRRFSSKSGPDGYTSSPTIREKPMSNPIYKETEITVPWTGPVLAYHTSGYITNADLKTQVDLLELRFRKQSEILARHGHRTSVLQKITRNKNGSHFGRFSGTPLP
ncbi:uncharacterized protein LOC127840170 isoform X2 [Dreissena polymorpha]|uniref:uncharacterized protein LOC127840170 isoform X2 n=1 Tax=Dreissena polymorpha TaxID=45954 RepID=UPI002264C6E0|nr:uncharacterized protein LOC127840170 isoform X2 [Dreissena polymorpha]